MARPDPFASAHGYSFDWTSKPVAWPGTDTRPSAWNSRDYRTPVPCQHADNCYYGGQTDPVTGRRKFCMFVHPGEEGQYRKYFAASGDQPAKVRLCDDRRPNKKASYYERCELGMTWPEWKRHMGMEPAAPVASAAPAALSKPPLYPSTVLRPAPSHRRKEIIDLRPSQEEFPALKAVAAEPPCEPPAATEPSTAALPDKQTLGNYLYYQIQELMLSPDCGELLYKMGFLTTKATPGKLTGMILDGSTEEEIIELLHDINSLGEVVTDACAILAEKFPECVLHYSTSHQLVSDRLLASIPSTA